MKKFGPTGTTAMSISGFAAFRTEDVKEVDAASFIIEGKFVKHAYRCFNKR